jgi:hypothetical protein
MQDVEKIVGTLKGDELDKCVKLGEAYEILRKGISNEIK